MIFFISCSQSDEQREFEREAFSPPEDITETGDNGGDNIDPDDWRVGPFFQGLIEVFPVSPNPVLTSNQIRIEVLVYGFDSINGLRILAYYGQNSFKPLREDHRSPLPPGTISYSIQAIDIAQFPANPQGLYRIILEDYKGNIISYGDVRIE